MRHRARKLAAVHAQHPADHGDSGVAADLRLEEQQLSCPALLATLAHTRSADESLRVQHTDKLWMRGIGWIIGC